MLVFSNNVACPMLCVGYLSRLIAFAERIIQGTSSILSSVRGKGISIQNSKENNTLYEPQDVVVRRRFQVILKKLGNL